MSPQAPVTLSSNQPSPRPALNLPRDLQASLETRPAALALGDWRRDYSAAAWEAWTTGAIEVCQLHLDQGSPAIDVTLAFRDDLSVRYIQECRTDDEDGGCIFHSYLFTVPERLQVVVWIEDDWTHALMAYRGDPELVEEIGLQLKLFGGACVTGCDA